MAGSGFRGMKGEEAKARHGMAVLRRGLTEPWEKSGVLEREPSQEVVLAAIRAAEEAGDRGPRVSEACWIRCQAGALGDLGGFCAR